MQAEGKVLTVKVKIRGCLNCTKHIIKEKYQLSCSIFYRKLDRDITAAWLCKVNSTAHISGWPHSTLLNFTLIHDFSFNKTFFFFKLFSLLLGCGQKQQEEPSPQSLICLQAQHPHRTSNEFSRQI